MMTMIINGKRYSNVTGHLHNDKTAAALTCARGGEGGEGGCNRLEAWSDVGQIARTSHTRRYCECFESVAALL